MGAGAGQPPDRHRRPIVGRQQLARGTIYRQQFVVARRADQRDGVEPRRSHCAVPVAAGHARVSRAPVARRQHRRSGYAQSRVYRDAAGPVSRRRRSAGWCHDGQRALGRRRCLWRRRVVCGCERPELPFLWHRPARQRACIAAATRCVRSLRRRTRSALRAQRVGALRVAGSRRLRRSRYVRHVERTADVRQRLVPSDGPLRLGAVPGRPLGVDRSVGLDVGRR